MINTPNWIPDSAFAEGASTILFKIGSFELHLYSLMIMLGIACSILTISFFWYRSKLNFDILLVLILITIPASIVGSRLLFVIEGLIYRPNDPFGGSKWYEVWKGGLSIQGGVILAMALDLLYAYTKRDVIDIRKAAGFIIPTILIGQVIGRFGNYANHEVYGKIDWSGASSLFFGHAFAKNMYIYDTYSSNLLNASGYAAAAYRYPLFLFEAFANLAGYLIIVWVFNLFGLSKPGTSAGLYLVWYGVVRLSMEPLRQEAFNLYLNIAIAFAIIGSIIVIYYQFFGRVKYFKVKNKYYYEWYYEKPIAYNVYVENTKISVLFKKLINVLTNFNFKKDNKKIA